MPRIGYAFRYKASGVVSAAIQFVTRSQHRLTHVEVILPDGRSFSSREFEGASFKQIDYKPEEWIRLWFEVTDEQMANILAVCARYDGSPYDYLGIIRYALNIQTRRLFRFARKWPFCSEVGVDVAHQHGEGLDLDPNFTSPQRLFDVLAGSLRWVLREDPPAAAAT